MKNNKLNKAKFLTTLATASLLAFASVVVACSNQNLQVENNQNIINNNNINNNTNNNTNNKPNDETNTNTNNKDELFFEQERVAYEKVKEILDDRLGVQHWYDIQYGINILDLSFSTRRINISYNIRTGYEPDNIEDKSIYVKSIIVDSTPRSFQHLYEMLSNGSEFRVDQEYNYSLVNPYKKMAEIYFNSEEISEDVKYRLVGDGREVLDAYTSNFRKKNSYNYEMNICYVVKNNDQINYVVARLVVAKEDMESVRGSANITNQQTCMECVRQGKFKDYSVGQVTFNDNFGLYKNYDESLKI